MRRALAYVVGYGYLLYLRVQVVQLSVENAILRYRVRRRNLRLTEAHK